MTWTWKWEDYTLATEGTRVCLHKGTVLLFDGETQETFEPTLRDVRALLDWLTETHVADQHLRALVYDLTVNYDMLEWLTCPQCGGEAFLVGQGDETCGWCGLVLSQ